ncbi:MAG: YidC/Oxa1 family membrane protein insertase [Candidatus Gastranaerophilales bacterium]|nr:YidC/Oxa1 family membrane protein insertase [Candidatus Gastranaerophilales bacterium]
MDFVGLTIQVLKVLSDIAGSYGLGIIVLTVIVRMAMWPLSLSQQRSMKQMQSLQPRMKAIQERYKNDPQTMQRKMMEFYKEHNFNPMSGCFPLLIQMPIFILLYSSLMSPQFIQMAGNAPFLFVSSLDSTLRTNAGISKDGVMGVSNTAKFMTGKTAVVYLKNETLKDVKIDKPNDAVSVQGALNPGQPMDLKMSIDSLKDLKFSQFDKIEKADVEVTNIMTKETEMITFERKGYLLTATVPTKLVQSQFHFDVLVLIILFGLTMVFTQKAMMAMNKGQELDPSQAAMQKSMNMFMPVMLCGTFILIPIPAGVLLYLISSNIVQIIQTILINKKLDVEFAAKKAKVTDEEIADARQIKAKE